MRALSCATLSIGLLWGGAGYAQSDRRIDTATLETTIERARAHLQRFVPAPDLIESLYFGWFDRPYRRATIAVTLKTAVVLERELRFRRLGNGAMRDRDVAAMLDWLDKATERAAREARRPGFKPHRMRFGLAAVATAPRPDLSADRAPRFAFMDRSYATKCDKAFGDFDLLACLGMGVTGLSPRTALFAGSGGELDARAAALGIRILVQSTETSAAQSANRLVVRPLSLAALLSEERGEQGALLAVLDPPDGESWGESLARRSLLRAVASGQDVIAVGWIPPHRSDARRGGLASVGATRLAMWAHALAGQRLGVIEGWRDLRDGSRLPYAPLTTYPAHVETVAHTALDLLYHARELEGFAGCATLAVVIDDTAVTGPDGDHWSEQAAELFNTLLDRQLLFDVVPAGRIRRVITPHDYGAVLVAVGEANTRQMTDSVRAIVGAGARVVAPPDNGSVAQLSGHIKSLPEPIVSRDLRDPTGFVAYGPGGQVASACLVFNGRTADGKPCFAVANLHTEPRSVALKRPVDSGNPPFRDVLTDETIAAGGDPVTLAGHQIRLFVPAVD